MNMNPLCAEFIIAKTVHDQCAASPVEHPTTELNSCWTGSDFVTFFLLFASLMLSGHSKRFEVSCKTHLHVLQKTFCLCLRSVARNRVDNTVIEQLSEVKIFLPECVRVLFLVFE